MPVKGTTKTTRKGKQKASVIGRRLNGATIREIAQAEGMDKNTVVRILSLPEVQMAVSRMRSRLMQKGDEITEKLIAICLGKTDKGDGRRCVEVLRGIGVLTPAEKLEIASSAGERTYAYTRFVFISRFGREPSQEELLEFDKTLPRRPIVKGELPA